MIKGAIPVLRGSSSASVLEFYVKALGFHNQFAYRADESKSDPCYMGFHRDNAWLHVSTFPGDGVYGCVVNLVVDNVDELFEELKARGTHVDLEPTDQTWGNREMYVRDPDGNSIRFLQARLA